MKYFTGFLVLVIAFMCHVGFVYSIDDGKSRAVEITIDDNKTNVSTPPQEAYDVSAGIYETLIETKCSICSEDFVTRGSDEEKELVPLLDACDVDESIHFTFFTVEAVATPCLHKFHRKCILEWFETKSDCPICRRPCGSEYLLDVDYAKLILNPFHPENQDKLGAVISALADYSTQFKTAREIIAVERSHVLLNNEIVYSIIFNARNLILSAGLWKNDEMLISGMIKLGWNFQYDAGMAVGAVQLLESEDSTTFRTLAYKMNSSEAFMVDSFGFYIDRCEFTLEMFETALSETARSMLIYRFLNLAKTMPQKDNLIDLYKAFTITTDMVAEYKLLRKLKPKITNYESTIMLAALNSNEEMRKLVEEDLGKITLCRAM